jgi:ubiquinone/menaquinone biosynthesis C-methylase UbiE
VTQYWSDLSRSHLGAADDGLSVVCYAGMPVWFNAFLDFYQRKAMDRLLSGQDLSYKRVLDVGTGVGRWARWYSEWPGNRVVGIDIEPVRLVEARKLGGEIDYQQMAVDQLSFPDASFDLVNSVTVLQHVDHDTKRAAISEFSRVLSPGGLAVFFELTDTHDDASHVYAWSDREWRRAFAANGFVLTKAIGDQYVPVLRLMKTAYGFVRGGRSRHDIMAMKSGRTGPASKLLLPLKLAVLVSYPIEEVARFLPPALGRMTGYLLMKAPA